jgi:hypothetical protein
LEAVPPVAAVDDLKPGSHEHSSGMLVFVEELSYGQGWDELGASSFGGMYVAAVQSRNGEALF